MKTINGVKTEAVKTIKLTPSANLTTTGKSKLTNCMKNYCHKIESHQANTLFFTALDYNTSIYTSMHNLCCCLNGLVLALLEQIDVHWTAIWKNIFKYSIVNLNF